MNPEDLTEDVIVKAVCEKEPDHYLDFEDFAYQCHSASLALVRSGLLGKPGPRVRVARGTCHGVPGQHSWVVLGNPYDPKAQIVDITLWSYDRGAPRIWVGDRDNMFARHYPKGGGWVFDDDKPSSRGGEHILLEEAKMSPWAREFLRVIGPLDAPGWAALWSRTGMLGWPAKEILEAFLDQYPSLGALVPIDVIGMLTDRNPEGLYW